MNSYTGKYYIQGGTEHSATFSFLKDRLSISFSDEKGIVRNVFWYYDEIVKENFRHEDKGVIRHAGYPVQTIEVASKEFTNEVEVRIAQQNGKFFKKIFGHSLPLLRVFLVLFLILLAAYIWLVPYLAGRFAGKVPVSYEEKLGQAMYNAIKAGFQIDEKKTMYINDFFKELNISTPYTIHITVVKDDVPNAFAMPGGNIIVYDKILAGMTNYDELAALLSHEFVHIQNRHTTKSLFRQWSNSVFLSVIFGNAHELSNVIIRNADNLKSLSYSRRLEKEADLAGLKILSERKIDGAGFIHLFQMLKNQGNGKVSEWMSSHPDLDRRIKYIQQDPNFNKSGTDINETLKIIFLKIKTGE